MVRFSRPARFRSPATIVRVAVVVALGLGDAAGPVAAQGFGWFGNLFGGGAPSQPAPPPYPGGYYRHSDGSYQQRRRAPRRQAAEPARPSRDAARDVGPREPKPPVKNASVFVHVFGDSFGQSLAAGLDDALVDRQDVAIVRKAKGSSGLVASDFYDWPKAIDDFLVESDKASKAAAVPSAPKPDADKSPATPAPADARQVKVEAAKPDAAKPDIAPERAAKPNPNKIDAAVMMIGSNDRQPLVEGGKTLAPGTPDWTAAYKKRVLAIDDAFRKHNVPLVWVGVPIARDDSFADDMAAFNDIYREVAAKTGAVFVDTWEAFSDDDGDFSPVGPDINGQIVRLRTADGVYFTKAGGRKLAHFVEAHVRRALDGKVASPALPDIPNPKTAPRKPDAGPISNLTEPALARDGRLAASFHTEGAREPQTEAEKDQPPAGRADDLRWPAGATPNP